VRDAHECGQRTRPPGIQPEKTTQGDPANFNPVYRCASQFFYFWRLEPYLKTRTVPRMMRNRSAIPIRGIRGLLLILNQNRYVAISVKYAGRLGFRPSMYEGVLS